jgi:hypothetical protein
MMEAARTFETPDLARATWHQNPEDGILNSCLVRKEFLYSL